MFDHSNVHCVHIYCKQEVNAVLTYGGAALKTTCVSVHSSLRIHTAFCLCFLCFLTSYVRCFYFVFPVCVFVTQEHLGFIALIRHDCIKPLPVVMDAPACSSAPRTEVSSNTHNTPMDPEDPRPNQSTNKTDVLQQLHISRSL